MYSNVRRAAPLLTLMLAACGGHTLVHPSTWHIPWRHRAPVAAPAVVNVLEVQVAEGVKAPALPQRWQRNTLVVDLTAMSGEGSIAFAPRAGTTWPVRLALVVRAGAFGELEIRGAQRQQFAVPASGGELQMEIAPEDYAGDTRSLTLVWRPGST